MNSCNQTDRSGLTSVESEAWVLATEDGRALLSEVAQVSSPLPADLARWRRFAEPERVAAAIRVAETRRRGRAKFARADAMWLDPVGLEQATAEVVATHKAARFEAPVVVDLCSGIGGDAIALARRSRVLAVDLDPGMCRRIAWNAAAHQAGDRVLPCRGKAERFAIPPEAWVHIDPDRRASRKGRARAVDDYVPGLGFLAALPRRVAAGAIKLSPASDFATAFADAGFEVELISLGGECKEATVWFGAAAKCRRRATSLPGGASWTDRDGEAGAVAPIGPVSRYIYDPDPALVRAGLLDGFALVHHLNRIKPELAYLTSDGRVVSDFLSAFEVCEVLPLDLRRLRRWVGNHAIGALEIKVRGLDLTPERVRATLRPKGEHAATLILCGGAGRSLAIVASRVGYQGADDRLAR